MQTSHSNTFVHLTIKSSNVKTGPIPVSTTEKASCWTGCAMASACYADRGPLAIHWRAVSNHLRGMAWTEFCQAISELPDGQLWRHNQAGDLPGVDHAIDRDEVDLLILANKGKRGFTYTHKPVLDGLANATENRAIVRECNESGFTVNLSGNNLRHADALADLGIAPVVTVLPETIQGNAQVTTPKGRRVVVCPATYRDNVSCASCQLCSRANRSVIVGFPVHGSGKKHYDG